VVISKNPLTDHVPLVRIGEGDINTQYEMNNVERVGLLKMDFLGLRNLTVMKSASDEIRRTVNPAFDLAKMPDDDARTFEMLGRGETLGVFQLESDGMRRVCTELKPSSIDDIIALVALYRPGPMELIPQYIAAKHGRVKASYLHPKLEPILRETYGIPVYQESVMQIARDIAGFTMGQADELRKVMGKKLKDKMPIYHEKFVDGAMANGLERALAEKIFAYLEPFAGYGFNKSHAAAYGWIAYQTAYLKANFPIQYFAALMTSVKDKTDKLVEYIDEAKKLGVAVLPPDVNESLVHFAVVGGQVRFGLAAIKGVGEGAVQAILAARERDGRFTDLFDLARRVDGRQVNRKVFEALIKCGALDALGANRAQLLDGLDLAFDLASRATRDRELGQDSLFGSAEAGVELAPQLRALPAPPAVEQLAWEKETLGIFVSGHPLADVADQLMRGGTIAIKDLRVQEDGAIVTVAGMLTEVRRTLTKAQQQMLIAVLEDMTGVVEVIVFPKSYPQLQGAFVRDGIVTVKGRLAMRERRGGSIPGEEPVVDLSVQAMEVRPFERRIDPPQRQGWHVQVRDRKQIDDLARLLDDLRGDVAIVLHADGKSQRMPVGISSGVYVRSELEAIFGRAAIWEGPAG
jgi:DNA polymerase III subunit alpha